jgi:hypothetical protein
MTWATPQTPTIHAASGGASLAPLASLIGGDPAAILRHVGQLVQHAQKLVQLVGELDKKKQELRDAWPKGSASDQAGESTASALDTFIQAIKPMTAGAQALTGVATSLQGAQSGYTSAMTATEPVVQSLMSNPFTQSAGIATAMGVTGQVKTFLTAIGSLLTSLGLKDIGAAFTQLGTIIGSVESVFNAITGQSNGTTPGATTPAALNNGTLPGTTTPAALNNGTLPGATTPAALNNGTGYGGSTGLGAGTPSNGTLGGGAFNSGALGSGLPSGSPMAFATDPTTGMPYGYGIDSSTGQLCGTGIDPQTGLPLGSGTGAGLADSWVPVDPGASGGLASGVGGSTGWDGAGSGGSSTDQAGSSTGAATDWTQGDDATHIQVSSGGETVSFDIDAGDDATTITAEVGSGGDQTNVEITVAPRAS